MVSKISDADKSRIRSDKQIIEAALAEAGAVKRGDRWHCWRQDHKDADPSAGIFEAEGGVWRFKCQGCGWSGDAIAIRMEAHSERFPDACQALLGGHVGHASTNGKSATPKPKKKTVHLTKEKAASAVAWSADGTPGESWDYHNADGTHSFTEVRIELADGKKTFRTFHAVDGGFKAGDPPGDLPVYGLPELLENPAAIICRAEGPKCCDRLRALGYVATTSAHGALSAKETDWKPLAKRTFYQFNDQDKNGRTYNSDTAAILTKLGCKVYEIELPEMFEGADVADHIDKLREAGNDDDAIRADIQERIDNAKLIREVAPHRAPATSSTETAATEQQQAPAPAPHGIHVELMPGRSSRNGELKRRCKLVVPGQEPVVARVTLDSDLGMKRQARSWADAFGIDEEPIRQALWKAAAQAVKQLEKQDQDAPEDRARDHARAFLESLDPIYHRDGNAIGFEQRGEVKIASLWTLATDEVIDGLKDTQEGHELGQHSDDGATWRQLVGLWKEAVAFAAAEIMAQVPAFEEMDSERLEIVQQTRDRLVQWLIRDRVVRMDIGSTKSTSIHRWASGIQIDAGWVQFHGQPIFGRRDKDQVYPQIAVKGELLADELRATRKNMLSQQLRDANAANTDAVIKQGGKSWRLWQFDPSIIEAIAVTEVTPE